MLNLLLQSARPVRSRTFLSTFRHLGAFGLFFLAILDSSPVPTFGGPDILVAILVFTHRLPWYAYSAIATAGSIIGAYVTFRLARKAGQAYLDSKFGKARVARFLRIFEKSGTAALAASTAIPFPFPTSLVFAAAGASKYRFGRFLSVVAISRAVRYTVIAFLAERYGRHFMRMFLHPTQNLGWFALFAVLVAALVGAGIFVNRHLAIGDASPSLARN